MPVRLTILGSGSSGNSAYLETDEARLLIDAGFSARQLRQRLAAIGRVPESLTGILITHEHSDHVQGLTTLAGKLGVPVYCNRLTKDALAWDNPVTLNWQIFATGARFDVGDVNVESFSIPHDAQDPVGFLVRTVAGAVGFLTDLGHATKLVLERVRPARVLVLETNHDVRLLQECPHRPWSLKQRILSRHGHLCNEAAADVLAEIMSAELRHLYLGHLSRDCNRPDLALRVVQRRLAELGASHCTTTLTEQAAACATLELADASPLAG
jgi:phosphoribosyl 1,2-cyclic phosphodiesterase